MALTERHELALNTETKTAVLPDNPLFYPTIYVQNVPVVPRPKVGQAFVPQTAQVSSLSFVFCISLLDRACSHKNQQQHQKKKSARRKKNARIARYGRQVRCRRQNSLSATKNASALFFARDGIFTQFVQVRTVRRRTDTQH